MASIDSGRGFGVGGSGEAHGVHRVLIPALHEIFLKAQLADGRIHAGFDARVAHGQNARFHAEFFRDDGGGVGERLALGQQARTQQVHGEVAVAGVEPCGLAELSHGLQAEEGVAFHAPSALAAQHAGEHIGDGVDVGGNVEAPPEQVIAGVDDQGDFFGGHDLAEAVDELGAASAAAEDADHRLHHAALFIFARP